MSVSPDGKYLAVGSHDNRIYVYDIADNYKLVSRCKGHSSYIMAIDWDCSSKWMRSNCGAYELLFWNMPEGTQDKSGRSNTVGVEWATKTVKFSWHVNGIYPKG